MTISLRLGRAAVGTTACDSAVYSATGRPPATSRRSRRRASRPSSSVDCGFTLTNTFSIAAVGACSRTMVETPWKIVPSRVARSAVGVRITPLVIGEPVAADVDDAEAGDAQAGVDAENSHE